MPHHPLGALRIFPEAGFGAAKLEIVYFSLISSEVKVAPQSDRVAP